MVAEFTFLFAVSLSSGGGGSVALLVFDVGEDGGIVIAVGWICGGGDVIGLIVIGPAIN